MKVSAYIDGNNLHLGVKAQGWKINYQKFRRYLHEKYHVEKAFIFIGERPGYEGLYKSLNQAGYLLIFKPTLKIKVRGKDTVKGNADAEMVMHCTKDLYTNQFDKAVIITGDGDFHCIIEHLSQKGKLLKLIVPNIEHYSALLKVFRKDTVGVNNLKKTIGE